MNTLPDMALGAEAGLPASELDAVLDRLGEAALPLTGAVACRIDLPAEIVGPRAICLAAPLSGPLADHMQQMAKARVQPLGSAATLGLSAPALGAARDAANTTLQEVEGTRYRFVQRSIAGPCGLVLGDILLGFDATRTGADEAEQAALHFTALLASLLAERRGKLAMARDMAALGRHAAHLQRRLRKDPLTGLENATSFQAGVRDDLDAGRGAQALVLFDVDHFKDINDLHGHQFGDIYLRAIAGALSSSLPADARIGRIGGDEFAALLRLPSDPEPALASALRRCQAALQGLGESLGKPEIGGVSIGAALFPRQAETYDTLFELADTALYAAKRAGRGAEMLFDPRRHLRFSLRELMRNFSGALAAGEVRPVFHPVVDLATGVCTGYEVLARWQAPGGDMVGPELFSPIFESPVLAEQLTRSMIGQATEWLSRLPQRCRAEGQPLRIGINVTRFDLCNRSFADDLARLLADFGLSWEALVIEVPETVMLGETGGNVFEALRDLRARGAKIALDDFGTGYGSLRHLGTWPIDMLKIDCQFVQGLSARPRDRAVVEAILSMARRFGFRVVAEGIETPGQLSYLRAMGCDAGQGHLISAPLSIEDLASAPAVYPLSGVEA
ncbi:putative bifunctional diguanylate cyclase/phosphodiesterase [Alloyangia pacifica]|uniref:putative bifunctional diguanylate cyclase/phosphodiesterase n=1 Tax=Alloyangia pacifica TaxID=311180 RepID=UPI001CD34ED4|nr:bifunctional diguanylate cyclase/phosphodiesterase [Alloyangia pacifica]MCA0996570.1 bifunctional diguanylate cyclase/phosphodiesterase [Alloyangia pacifica]